MLRAVALAVGIGGVAIRAGAEPEEKKGPPFGERKKAPPPKPERRSFGTTLTSGDKTFAVDFDLKPGVPEAAQVAEIVVALNEIPTRPHPTFGTRVPLMEADVVFELTSPGGEVVGRYLAHPIPLSRGKYGVHMTPGQDGVYSMIVRVKGSDGSGLELPAKLPVNIWPLPEEIEKAAQEGKGKRQPIKL